MAFNILSLKKFVRTKENHPNYIADVEFDGIRGEYEIYTNAYLFSDGNSGVYATNHNYDRMNGNLYLKIEALTPSIRLKNKKLEEELKKILEG